MPVWLIPSAIGAGLGFLFKPSSSSQPDPIGSLTNLLIVGTVLFLGFKVLRKI